MLPAVEFFKLITPKKGISYFEAQNDASIIQKMTKQLLSRFIKTSNS